MPPSSCASPPRLIFAMSSARLSSVCNPCTCSMTARSRKPWTGDSPAWASRLGLNIWGSSCGWRREAVKKALDSRYPDNKGIECKSSP